MATYAIGDVHGCFRTLRALLKQIGLGRHDRLWLVGDLVNRGPASLEVLRWAAGFGDRLTAVLGNHDLHLLACAAGCAKPRRRDTFDELLAAPDAPALLEWLRRRPLLHRDGRFVMVHAGLLPAWAVADAELLARDLERELADDKSATTLLSEWRGSDASRWTQTLPKVRRQHVALSGLTRLRCCTADGELALDYSGPPQQAPRGTLPWFDHESRRRDSHLTVVFGHWAALGLLRRPGFLGLDSACVWGRKLSAVCLDDGMLFQEAALDGSSGD